MNEIDVIVLFGASGDLAAKMLLPALYRLEERDLLEQRIVGVALETWDASRFRAHAADAIAAAIDDVDPGIQDRLMNRLDYVSGDYTETDLYERLAKAVDARSRCLHYLAIPPSMFEQVVSNLSKVGLIDQGRVVVEKPFGRDRRSARELNGVLHSFLREEDVYRIDHFLGKEPVENLVVFRYANSIFEPIWNRHYIDHIQVTMAESFGVGSRGALYESLGVVRDVVQNHILQVICLLTMGAPVTPGARSLADERANVLRAMPTVAAEDVVFGQYDGYHEVDHVSPGSTVPTFVALRASIDTPRWHGVPIYVAAGKALATTATEATVVFRETPPLPFATDRTPPRADRLVFRIGPTNGVDLVLQTKRPGEEFDLVTTPLTVDYEQVLGRMPVAHERLIHDALTGDRTQFAREDAVEEAWRIVDEILDPSAAPIVYRVGTWGPASSSDVLAPHVRWLRPVAADAPQQD